MSLSSLRLSKLSSGGCVHTDSTSRRSLEQLSQSNFMLKLGKISHLNARGLRPQICHYCMCCVSVCLRSGATKSKEGEQEIWGRFLKCRRWKCQPRGGEESNSARGRGSNFNELVSVSHREWPCVMSPACPLYPLLRTSIGSSTPWPLAFAKNMLYSFLFHCCTSSRLQL